MEHRKQLRLLTFLCLLMGVSGTCDSRHCRTVSTAEELGDALMNEVVQNITIKGRVHLTKENWLPYAGGTAILKTGRHVILQSDKDTPASAVLDLGTLVDAIHLARGAHLELWRLHIPNSGDRKVKRPSERVRINVAGAFALWPSVTVAKDSKMSFQQCVFYYWSDEEWDSCDKFREVATPILNPQGLPDLLEWRASDTQVFMKGRQDNRHRLINVLDKTSREGAMMTSRINHTLVCVPNIFRHNDNGSVWTLLLASFIGSILGATAIAQYFGFFKLGKSLSDTVSGSHQSDGSQRVSLGSGPMLNSVEHISWLVRERQRVTIDGLEIGELLGRGSFGRVYKGRWRGALVAVKVVAHDCSIASLAETLRESALSTSIQHPNVVATFKVRTVRAKREIDSLASRWALGTDNNLDDAAGGQHFLLARALSKRQQVDGAAEKEPLSQRCDSAKEANGRSGNHLRSFSLDFARWQGLPRRLFWNSARLPASGSSESPRSPAGRAEMLLRPHHSAGPAMDVVLDSARAAGTGTSSRAYADAESAGEGRGSFSPLGRLAEGRPMSPTTLAAGDEAGASAAAGARAKICFPPQTDGPAHSRPSSPGRHAREDTAAKDETVNLLQQDGAAQEGHESGPRAIASVFKELGDSSAADVRVAYVKAGLEDPPAKIAAALQAWRDAAGPSSPRSGQPNGLGQGGALLTRAEIELLETWLILEYCDHGSFENAVRSGRFLNDLASGVLCLMDIAAGMAHLHSLGVLHADLKGANVLLKSSAVSNYDPRGYMCKLADFGLSRVMENNSTHVSTITFGTAAYMPAEMLMESKMTKAADVYSFAMIMWELVSGKKLFEGLRQSQIICKVMTGWRPSVPDDCHAGYRDLMVACWHTDPSKRPDFVDVLRQLRAVYKDLRMTSQRAACSQRRSNKCV